jgi:hypothetical protein
MNIGDSVKVKPGYDNDEYPEIDFTGWQGRVFTYRNLNEYEPEKSEDWWVEIEFDSITLKQMPEKFITESIRENIDYRIMEFRLPEVEKVNPRDTYKETRETRHTMNQQYGFESELDKDAIMSELIYDSLDHMN